MKIADILVQVWTQVDDSTHFHDNDYVSSAFIKKLPLILRKFTRKHLHLIIYTNFKINNYHLELVMETEIFFFFCNIVNDTVDQRTNKWIVKIDMENLVQFLGGGCLYFTKWLYRWEI